MTPDGSEGPAADPNDGRLISSIRAVARSGGRARRGSNVQQSRIPHMSNSKFITALAVGALAATAHGAAAQAGGRFELRPYVGAYIPTGDQRDFLKDAVLAGAELSVRVIPAVAITGNFAWAPSKDRITAGNQTLDIYQYDVGAELRPSPLLDGGVWQFTPFIGAGVGGRTYDYRDLNVGSKTNFDGYGALGGDRKSVV